MQAAAAVGANTASVARRSLVARRDLAVGTPVTAEVFTAKRPGGGISPARLLELSGARRWHGRCAPTSSSPRTISQRRRRRSTVRRVAVLTGGRADHGLLRPTIRALRDDPRFAPLVVAAAMHLDPAYGDTLSVVEADGVPIVGPRADAAATSPRGWRRACAGSPLRCGRRSRTWC